ncbi:hypothetical protein F8M41_008928 [Gigaspora margarita]|uniref:Uncharacterized protein n=1 Tax=Gigaspora margarita TaxID=4874 RepID=A0A8H4A492_GIGMA|nr:hypothetical protein F8M41_008928 [Gigaspora margarita]
MVMMVPNCMYIYVYIYIYLFHFYLNSYNILFNIFIFINIYYRSCWYRDSGEEYNIIWQWLTLFGWIYASILYCAIVVIMVIRKLRSINKEINDVYGYSTSQLSNYPTLINKKVISSVVRRIIWYPLVPLVTQFSNSSVETYAYFYRVVSYPLLLLCVIGMSLQGLLNSLASTQDIAVTHAFQAVKLQLWISNVNSYENHYPHRSHNKGIIDEFSMLRKSNNCIELKGLNCNKTDIIKNDEVTNEDIINDNVNNNNNNNNLVLQPSFLEWLSYMLLIKLFSVPKNSSRFSSPGHSLIIDSFDGKKTNNSSTFFGMDDLKQDVTLDNQNEDQDIHLAYLDPVHLKDYSQLNLLSHCLYPSTSSDPLIGSSRSNTININNLCTPLNSTANIIDNDEGRIDINSESVKGVSKESTIRVSKESIKRFGSDIDISQEMETFKLMLKRL